MTATIWSDVAERLPPGTRVEVRTAFDRSWAKGFEVADAAEDGYVLRRCSDGTVVPRTFPDEDVRRERRPMWWV